MMKKILIYLLLVFIGIPTMAQADHLTWWGQLDIKKPLNNNWNLQWHSEWHQNVTNNQCDLWMTSPMVGKKITDWLRTDIGYVHARTRTKGHDGIPSYYRVMHRPFISATLSQRVGQVNIALREYWEWIWMPECIKNDEVKKGIAYHELRHRLKFDWQIPDSRFVPYGYLEARHLDVMEQARISFGTVIKINKHNQFDVGWFYQDRRHKTNNHVFTVTYGLTL